MPPEESTNPRELAQQLVEQAKARALAQQLVEQAKARAAAPSAAPETPAAPEAPAAPKRSLADRAKRPISAKEALQQALEAEKRSAEEAAQADEKRKVARQAAEKAKAAAAQAAAEQKVIQEREAAAAVQSARPVPQPAVAKVLKDPAVVIANRIPGVTVRSTRPAANRDVFHALWTAHRARAIAENDLQLMISADVLLDAARRVPEGALFTARIERDGQGYALWVDVANGTVLAAVSPPEVFLAGL